MSAVHELTVTQHMALDAATLFRAWSHDWGAWFAAPDSVRMTAEVGAPFYFAVEQRFDDGRPPVRHPHYGRVLALEPNSLVALSWVTRPNGTGGAEATMTVRLSDDGNGGTTVTLTHAGFITEVARDRHAMAWPMILAQQERTLAQQTQAPSAHAVSPPARNRSVPEATLIPVRSYPDLAAAVAWLRDVFGCRERLRIPGHRVQLTLGSGAMVAVAWDASAAPASGGRPPATLMVRVPDIDAAYARALARGAVGVAEPTDHAYGERQATLRDPAGHSWTLTQTIADVDPATWGGELVTS